VALPLRELALFAGAGGGILGGYLLGWKTVCAVEIEEYPRKVLLARQRDGILPRFPLWDDIKTFDGTEWQGRVDIVTGGFPCTDISCLKSNGQGIDGAKSKLWKEMARVLREIRPRFVFVENSPILTSRGLGTVLKDLAEMGYNAKWCVLGAGHLNYPIKRDRIWILGEHCKSDWVRDKIYKKTDFEKYIRRTNPACSISDVETSWLVSNSYAIRKSDGVAGDVDRYEAIGNGQVPAVAALAWEILRGE
jgi:DNA (cytosine-5)-methyltransferase 1